MRKSAAALLAGALVLTVLATGCASSNTSGGKAESSAAPSGTEAQSEAKPSESKAPADNSKKAIYVIVKALGNQYWSVLQAGAEQAGKDIGCKVVVVGTQTDTDVEGQVALLQNAVSAQAAGIVIAPLDSIACDTPITEAYKSGIPIILVDTLIKSDNYSAAFMTNNVEAGKAGAKEMIRRFKAKGVSERETAQIAIEVPTSGSQTTNDRIKGFNEYWEQNAPKSWEVLNKDIKVTDGDISKAVGFCQDFLTTYPHLKGFFSPANSTTVGFSTGLMEAKRTDITLIGFDFSTETETLIRKGGYDVASIVQRQYFMGYDGVKEALALANGEKVKEKSVDTGIVLVDGSNVDSDEVQQIIKPKVGSASSSH